MVIHNLAQKFLEPATGRATPFPGALSMPGSLPESAENLLSSATSSSSISSTETVSLSGADSASSATALHTSSPNATLTGKAHVAAAATPPASQASYPGGRSWQDEVIYMVMTDRFNDGDRTNDAGCVPSDPDRFHGGDWQGIIDKLDYIKGLGATAIWISPVHQQKRDFFGSDGYHGYWALDFYKTEPSFGTLKKLKELVEKAHEKGLKVIVDMVLNHTGYDAPISQDPDRYDWFHHYGNIKFYNQWWMENGQFCGLPDFAQENSQCSRWLIDMCKYWIDQTGIDGFRLDAVRHVPKEFWQQFSREIHAHAGDDFFLAGEIYHPWPRVTSPYQNEAKLDSVFDFPLNYAIRNTIGCNGELTYWDNVKFFYANVFQHPGESCRMLLGQNDGDMRRISWILKKDWRYRNPEILVTMLDNHDMTRFMTTAGPHGKEKLKMALALLLTMRGIPSVYYGTEVGMEGTWRENRKDMEFGKNPDLLAYFQKLARFRQDSVALRRGSYEELHVDKDLYAYARAYPPDNQDSSSAPASPAETVVVAMNNGSEKKRLEIPAPSGVKDGTVLTDLLRGSRYRVEEGKLSLRLAPRQVVILKSR